MKNDVLDDIVVTDIDVSYVRKQLQHPSVDANKYTRGRLVCVGGSEEFPGAIAMAAYAGFRSGAGYVEVWGSAEASRIVHTRFPSVVARSWDFISDCGSTFCNMAKVGQSPAGRPRAVLLGSGTRGRDIVEQRIFTDAIENAACPIILDGGALTFASGSQGVQALRRRADVGRVCVMTPHAGEAAVLAEGVGVDATTCPEKLALRLSEAYGACICLKGPDTFIANAVAFPGRVFAMREGGAVLAKAGTGDILAGIIAGLCAQGANPLECACAGSYLHALAGKCAELRLGDISACAEDVLDVLPGAVLQVCGY
jgi:hydroxyethylthiazole kinase-like uncharacterized protein yjeF